MSKPQKKVSFWFIQFLRFIPHEFSSFLRFLRIYFSHKAYFFLHNFENSKNKIVRAILLKRGRVNRMFLHLAAMSVLTIGIVVSPVISNSNPFLPQENKALISSERSNEPLTPEDVFETETNSEKRDKIINYTVQKGDSLSTIASKFGISEDTIKWSNNLKSDSITVGDELTILPITGVAHKVARGDNVYTIAKKYDANPQAIVDYPFNDFVNPQTFSLVEGQILFVPDGVMPEEKPRIIRRTYIATGPVSLSGEGFTWPMQGTINQFYAWYHKGIDIGGGIGQPIIAAHSGKVTEAYPSGWHGGYGVHVIVSGNNGYSTLYAHMQSLNVNVGDTVTAGSTVVGWVGMSGRTTGPHLHFEIRGEGGILNPMSFLK